MVPKYHFVLINQFPLFFLLQIQLSRYLLVPLSGGLKLIARRGLHNLVTGPYPRICFREDIERAKSSIPRRSFVQPGPDQLIDETRLKFSDSELAQLRFELDKYNHDTSSISSVFSQPRRSVSSIGGRSVSGMSVGGRSVSNRSVSNRSVSGRSDFNASGAKPGWK